MMRTFLWVLACCVAFLGIAASLELARLQSTIGVLAHTIPAGLLASIVDSMGMAISPHGLILGHGHGPPFLRPIGVLCVYGVPFAVLALFLFRARRRRDGTGTVALLTVLAFAPIAFGQEVTLIDFEDIPTRGWGEGGQVELTSQYANRGVTFNAPKVFDYTQGIPIPDFVHGTHAIQHCFAEEFCDVPLVATFAAPMARVRVWVGFARQNEATDITLTARDAAGGVIEQQVLTVPESGGPTRVEPLEVIDPNRGIVSVEIHRGGGINDVVVDDFEFDAGVPLPPPPAPLDLAIGNPSIVANPGEGANLTVPITVSGRSAGATAVVATSEGWEGPITATVPPLEPGQHSVTIALPSTLREGHYDVQLAIQTPTGEQETTLDNNRVSVGVEIRSRTIPIPVPIPILKTVRSIPKIPILIALAVLLAIGALVKVMKRAPEPAPAVLPQVALHPRVDPGTQSFTTGAEGVGIELAVSLRPEAGEQDSIVKEQP